MSNPLYVVDVDDNLGQLARKTPANGGPLTVMGLGTDGKPASFMTPTQLLMWQLLSGSGDVMACTGRQADGYRRLQLEFKPGWAIVAFGGAILAPDGTFEPTWADFVQRSMVPLSGVLIDLQALLERQIASAGLNMKSSLKGEKFPGGRTDLYIEADWSVKEGVTPSLAEEAAFEGIKDTVFAATPGNWKKHRNGRKLAIMPPFLGKTPALRHYLDNICKPRPSLVIGMGDSNTDADFMSICDYALMPTGSQLFQNLQQEGAHV